MSPEAQRIAIAEACGIVSKDKWGSLYKTPRGILRDCPDYPTDLNAMHEAEKVLTLPERRKYRKTLLGHCEPASIAIHATAAQRAEAFLLTIGKWDGAN
jgi:hypothetical protein